MAIVCKRTWTHYSLSKRNHTISMTSRRRRTCHKQWSTCIVSCVATLQVTMNKDCGSRRVRRRMMMKGKWWGLQLVFSSTTVWQIYSSSCVCFGVFIRRPRGWPCIVHACSKEQEESVIYQSEISWVSALREANGHGGGWGVSGCCREEHLSLRSGGRLPAVPAKLIFPCNIQAREHHFPAPARLAGPTPDLCAVCRPVGGGRVGFLRPQNWRLKNLPSSSGETSWLPKISPIKSRVLVTKGIAPTNPRSTDVELPKCPYQITEFINSFFPQFLSLVYI